MTDLLVPRKEYLTVGAHIGLNVKTEDMKQFIFKIRPDGLAVLDINIIDKRIRAAAKLISNSESILVVSRKDSAFKAVDSFAKAIDAKAIAGRFMPGSLTNPDSDDFFEPDVVIVTDPLVDKQVIKEAVQMRVPVISLVDTFNILSYIDLAIPCNNKGRESIGLIYYLMAKQVLEERDEDSDLDKKDFMPKKGKD